MDGIGKLIDQLTARENLLARKIRILEDLQKELNRPPHDPLDFTTIYYAHIAPWLNNQGFDIRLRARPGTYDQLVKIVNTRLKIGATKIDCDNVYFEGWRPHIKIYLSRH